LREVLGGVGGTRCPLAGAVTPLVEGDHVVPVGDGRRARVEPRGARGAAEPRTSRDRGRADSQAKWMGSIMRRIVPTRAATNDGLRCHLADFVSRWTLGPARWERGHRLFSQLAERADGKRVADVYPVAHNSFGSTNLLTE